MQRAFKRREQRNRQAVLPLPRISSFGFCFVIRHSTFGFPRWCAILPIRMERVLLQVKKKKDRRRLEDWLAPDYHIVLPNQERPLEDRIDLVIIDGPSLKQLRPKVRALRRSQEPVFLPFLLLTVRRRGSVPGRHLGRVVDDLLIRPLNENELRARVANLIRM